MTYFMLYLWAFPSFLWHSLKNVFLIDMHNLSISLHDELPESFTSNRVRDVKTSEQQTDVIEDMQALLPERWGHTKALPQEVKG